MSQGATRVRRADGVVGTYYADPTIPTRMGKTAYECVFRCEILPILSEIFGHESPHEIKNRFCCGAVLHATSLFGRIEKYLVVILWIC